MIIDWSVGWLAGWMVMGSLVGCLIACLVASLLRGTLSLKARLHLKIHGTLSLGARLHVEACPGLGPKVSSGGSHDAILKHFQVQAQKSLQEAPRAPF